MGKELRCIKFLIPGLNAYTKACMYKQLDRYQSFTVDSAQSSQHREGKCLPHPRGSSGSGPGFCHLTSTAATDCHAYTCHLNSAAHPECSSLAGLTPAQVLSQYSAPPFPALAISDCSKLIQVSGTQWRF